MGKYVSDAAKEEILDYIALSTRMWLCSQQPTTYTQAAVTYRLAEIVMAPGDFSKEDGAISGRKLVVADKLNVNSCAIGIVTHIALGGGDLRFVAVCPSVSINDDSDTGVVSVYSFAIEVRDPEG